MTELYTNLYSSNMTATLTYTNTYTHTHMHTTKIYINYIYDKTEYVVKQFIKFSPSLPYSMTLLFDHLTWNLCSILAISVQTLYQISTKHSVLGSVIAGFFQ